MKNAAKAAASANASNESNSQLPGTPINNRTAQRAYQIYLARGAQGGLDVEDWIQAEREILAERGHEQSSGSLLTTELSTAN